MDRSNHYERAFEGYLQHHGLGYIAVDETRRVTLDTGTLKSLDFFVFGKQLRFVVDIKGRRFPGGPPKRRRRVWECWSELSDIDGLERWAALAGTGYQGLLVFGYYLLPEVDISPTVPDLSIFDGRRYLWRAVTVEDYREHMRTRSPSWDTVSLRKVDFRRLVRPLSYYTRGSNLITAGNADFSSTSPTTTNNSFSHPFADTPG